MDNSSAAKPLARSMLETANDTLVTAFMDDSMCGWVFPDPAARSQGLRRLNREKIASAYAWTQCYAGRGPRPSSRKLP